MLLDTLTGDLELICEWFKHNRLIIYINWSKTNTMLFNFKSKPSFNHFSVNLSFDSIPIPYVDSVKLLIVIIDNKLKLTITLSIPVSKLTQKHIFSLVQIICFNQFVVELSSKSSFKQNLITAQHFFFIFHPISTRLGLKFKV